MRKLCKKGLTMLLAVAMIFGLSGMTAFAAEADNGDTQDASAEPEVLSEDEYGTAAIADTYDAKYDWYTNGSSPYQISSPEELEGFSDIVNGKADGILQDSFVGKTVELTTDLDMNAEGAVEWSYSTYEAGGTAGTTAYTAVETKVTVAADAKAFTPIGNMTYEADGTVTGGNAFLGTFDGRGHEIRNLYVTGGKGEYLGLFGTVGDVGSDGTCYGTVENFTLSGGVIYHTATTNPERSTSDELADFVGAACGKLNAGGTVQNIVSSMAVQAPNAFNVGGIVGFAGTPDEMGYSDNPSRDNTHVLCCANKGEATFGYNFVGGIVGESAATVKYCYNNSWVFNHNSGTKGSYGGIVGLNNSGNSEESVLAYCYNTGTVSNNGRPDYGATSRYYGGIGGWAHVGEGTNEIFNCYNIGDIPEGYAGGSDKAGFASITAGSSGICELTTRNNYSLDTDAIHNDAGTTQAMTGIKVSEDNFKLSSYNDGDILTNLGHYFVPDGTEEINGGYPVLWWETGASLPKIETLSIVEEPEKTVYAVGETFDPTGMEVVAEYENGVRELVIPQEIIYEEEPYELNDGYTYDHEELISGTHSVTITYTNGEGDTVTAEQPIYMEGDATPVELIINTPPTKTEYVAGQTFDPAGMTFTVKFNDDTEAPVNVSSVDVPTEPLALGQTSVTVSYTLGFDTVYAEQAITVLDPESVDKSALQKEYDADSLLDEEDYTGASWATFAEALENAKAILDGKLATQGEVDDALAALVSAKAGLEDAVYEDIEIYKDGQLITTVSGDRYKELQAAAKEQTFKMFKGDTEEYSEVTAHFVLVSDLLGDNQPDAGCGVNLNEERPWLDMGELYLYYKTDTGTYSQAVDGLPGYAGWLDGIGTITLGHEYVNDVCEICGDKITYPDIPVYKDGDVACTISGEAFAAAQANVDPQTFTYTSGSGTNEVTAQFVLITDLLDGHMPDEGCGFIATASDDFTSTYTEDYLDKAYLYYDKAAGYYRTAVNGSAGSYWAKDVASFTLGHDYANGVCIICGQDEPIHYDDIPVYKDGAVVYTIPGDDFAAAQEEAEPQTFTYTSGGETKEVTAQFVLITGLLDGNMPDEGCGFIATGSDDFTATFTEDYLDKAYIYYDATEGCYCTAVDGSAGRYWAKDVVSLTLGHIFEKGACIICGEEAPPITYPDIPVYKDGDVVYTISGDDFAAAQANVEPQTFTCTSDSGTTEVTANFVLITDLLDGNLPDEGCGFIATGSGDLTATFTEDYLDKAYLYYDEDEGCCRTAVNGSTDAYWAEGVESLTLGHDFVDGVCIICGFDTFRAELEQEVEEAAALNESDYTAESWATFKAALEKAQDLLSDPDASDTSMEAAYEELKDAMENLERVETPEPTVDKEELQEEIDNAEALTPEDYTEESWSALEGALQNAIDVANDENATPEQIKDAYDELQSAIDSLEKKSDTPGTGSNPKNGLYKITAGELWGYYVDDKVDTSYTGFASNENGDWYVINGYIRFDQNTVVKDTAGKLGAAGTWYYVLGNKVQHDFTGLANHKNDYGWWYIVKGEVDFSHNGVDKNKNGWWYVTGGKVQFGFTGLANYKNANGWWYIKEGKVDFTHNGVDKNVNGWFYVTGGKVQFGYTGVADYKNANGWWYIRAGKVDFTYTGKGSNRYGTWNVVNGKVQF